MLDPIGSFPSCVTKVETVNRLGSLRFILATDVGRKSCFNQTFVWDFRISHFPAGRESGGARGKVREFQALILSSSETRLN
jgi:hypothetical protein